MRSGIVTSEEKELAYRLLMPENQLVCRVCEETGLRIGDVLALRTADLKQRMTVHEQKTGKSKRIRFRADLFQALKRNAGAVYVFEGRTDIERHRTRQAVWKDLKRAARALRLPSDFTVHSLRKMYAVELLEAGYSPDDVQKELNHSDLSVTMLYLLAAKLGERNHIPQRRARPKRNRKRNEPPKTNNISQKHQKQKDAKN